MPGLVIASGDLIEGDASTANEVDYTISGLIATTLNTIADGQLANAKATLYTAGATITIISITLVNTGGAARTVNLYLKPGATSRRIIPKDVSLGAGYSLHTDGTSFQVVDTNGQIMTASAVSTHASNHTDGTDDIQNATDAQKGVATAAQITKLDGITALADVTSSNAPQAHKDSHDPDGSDPLDAAAAAEIAGVQAAAEGSASTWARADHAHQIQASIANDHLVTIDHSTPIDNDFAKFTASGLEGRNYVETRADLSLAVLAPSGSDYDDVNTLLGANDVVKLIGGVTYTWSDTVVIQNDKTLLCTGAIIKPSGAAVNLIEVQYGGSLINPHCDVSDFAYSGICYQLTGHVSWGANHSKQRIEGLRASRGWSGAYLGTALYIICDAADAFVAFNSIDIDVWGRFAYGIHVKVVSRTGSPAQFQPWCNAVNFRGILDACEEPIFLEIDDALRANGYSALAGNTFDFQIQPEGTATLHAVKMDGGAETGVNINWFHLIVWDWSAGHGDMFDFGDGGSHDNRIEVFSSTYDIILNDKFRDQGGKNNTIVEYHYDRSYDDNGRKASLTFIIDGGGAAITTGEKGHLEIPFQCLIRGNTALADQTGSIVVDIWKDTYANFPPADGDSITAAAPVTITAATKSQDTTLSGWTLAVDKGDILAFNVDSVTDIERLTISLEVEK